MLRMNVDYSSIYQEEKSSLSKICTSEYGKITKLKAGFRRRKNQYLMKYVMKDEHISHIAMFHKITTTGIISGDQNECRIEDFIDYIDHCQELGIKFVSLDNLLSMNADEACRNKAVITFDDGFESVHTVASKELFNRKIPYTCFITTSYLEQKGYISLEQLEMLSTNKLCTIGMHSDQHIFWRDKKASELKSDYLKCKQILSEIIKYEPQYYAFPYGSVKAVSSENIKTIRKMLPKAIFLTDQKKLSKNDIRNPLIGLPRLDIGGYYKGYYKKEYMGLSL